tara:strand:+ start:897 stop:1142 length:246 start_codon:yes stop_codon:yes gene_type:complete
VTVVSCVTEVIILNRQMAVIHDDFGAVVFSKQVQISLGVNVNLFFIDFAFKAQFLATFALVGLGFQGGVLVTWQVRPVMMD